MSWNYQREEQKFSVLPEGRYRIRIKSAEKAQSKSGNDMLVLQFEVSGSSSILYHYITFMSDKPEITNRMLTQFFDSFAGIQEGNFNMQSWIGQVGACMVKHQEYNGNDTAKISYFIHAGKQSDLPAWQEPNGNSNGGANNVSVDDSFIDNDEVPFD